MTPGLCCQGLSDGVGNQKQYFLSNFTEETIAQILCEERWNRNAVSKEQNSESERVPGLAHPDGGRLGSPLGDMQGVSLGLEYWASMRLQKCVWNIESRYGITMGARSTLTKFLPLTLFPAPQLCEPETTRDLLERVGKISQNQDALGMLLIPHTQSSKISYFLPFQSSTLIGSKLSCTSLAKQFSMLANSTLSFHCPQPPYGSSLPWQPHVLDFSGHFDFKYSVMWSDHVSDHMPKDMS